MECDSCSQRAVFLKPNHCKQHFIEYFEEKVKNTIDEFKLVSKGEEIAVACSGGKDSTTILYLLKKFHSKVVALAIDEGIEGYRDKTLVDLKKFCSQHNVKLEIHSFKEEYGKTLDVMLQQKNHPCTVCGTFRRYLLNNYGKKYDKIATGHNMDDESQAVMMNLLRGQTKLLSNSTPITSDVKGFVQKIKPLYFCSEKEVAAYALLKGFDVEFTECPNLDLSYRNQVREELNEYERKNPGTKENILRKHLEILKGLKAKKEDYKYCSKCGEPTSGEVCKACRLAKSFK